MGKHPGEVKLRIDFFSFFFFIFFFFSANMNLTVFVGILLAVTMASARRASLDEKIMRAADEADEPGEAKRAKLTKCKEVCGNNCKGYAKPCNNNDECCTGDCTQKGRPQFEPKRCWD